MSDARASMPPRAPGPANLARLLDAPAAGLSDGELLARFVARRDERAFEGLVDRLGPMVLATCRRMLPDRADADDAFQATFLVLVRRAGAVGRGELVGPWLHGVAVRVCRKARARSGRLRARERIGTAVAPEPPAPSPGPPGLLDAAEARAAIDEEVARLPGEARRLVVLADVEGLPRAEVAARLGWTENMVRGRLARARSRLRSRLVARGCAPAGLAPGAEDAAPAPLLPPLPPALAASTAWAALASIPPAGRGAAAALATASALSLADGVTRTMILAPWKLAGATLLGATLATAGAASILSARQVPVAPPAPPGPPAVVPADGDFSGPPVAPQPPAAAPLRALLEDRLRKAKARQEAQQAYYDEGRITIDRLIDADHQLMQAEHALAATPAEQRASVQRYVDRLRAIYDKEVAEQAVGRATAADIAEVDERLLEARILLARNAEDRAAPAEPGVMPDRASPAPPARPNPGIAGWQASRVLLAREQLKIVKQLHSNARIESSDYLGAIRGLAAAELAAATTPEARAAALQAEVKELEEAIQAVKVLVFDGKATQAALIPLQIALLDAQIQAAGGESPAPPAAQAPAKADPAAATGAVAGWKRARVEEARKVVDEARKRYPGELPASDYLEAERTLAEAELGAATTAAGRTAALQALVAETRKALAATEDQARRGEKTPTDVARMRIALLDAQIRAADGGRAAAGAEAEAVADLDRRLAELERQVDRVLDALDGKASAPERRR